MIIRANVFPKLQTVKILTTPLCKKRRFKKRFDTQHVKASQILAKSLWERFSHAFSSFWWKLILKMCPLVLREILGVFVNTLTADGKYPVQDCEKLQLLIQKPLLGNEQLFLNFLFHFLNLHQILNIFTKEIIIIANVFPKLQTVKIFIRPLCKKRHFKKRFDNQHVKASQILAKSLWERFYHVFSSLAGNLIWKISSLILGEIVGVFSNTLTADDKHPIEDWENLRLPVQMQLSDNWKFFLNFLFRFWNLHQILNILKKKIIVMANVFRKLQTVKIFVRRLCKKPHFVTRFDSQHVKVSWILAKSPWVHLYHLF